VVTGSAAFGGIKRAGRTIVSIKKLGSSRFGEAGSDSTPFGDVGGLTRRTYALVANDAGNFSRLIFRLFRHRLVVLVDDITRPVQEFIEGQYLDAVNRFPESLERVAFAP